MSHLVELPAFLKASAIATGRNRARKLVHFADEYRSVWRRSTVPGGMPELVRIAATTYCGRPIQNATFSPAHPDEVWCDDCVRVGNIRLGTPPQLGSLPVDF